MLTLSVNTERSYDPSTHSDFNLDLWKEAESFGGPDRNRVYGLSNTTTENLWMAHSVSTVRSSQSVSSIQSQEFMALQHHTTHLTKKFRQFSVNYEKLCQVVMDMRSQLGGKCPLLFWLYGPGNNQPPPPTPPRRHYFSLIFNWTYKFIMNIWILYYSNLFLHIWILHNFTFLIILLFC